MSSLADRIRANFLPACRADRRYKGQCRKQSSHSPPRQSCRVYSASDHFRSRTRVPVLDQERPLSADFHPSTLRALRSHLLTVHTAVMLSALVVLGALASSALAQSSGLSGLPSCVVLCATTKGTSTAAAPIALTLRSPGGLLLVVRLPLGLRGARAPVNDPADQCSNAVRCRFALSKGAEDAVTDNCSSGSDLSTGQAVRPGTLSVLLTYADHPVAGARPDTLRTC